MNPLMREGFRYDQAPEYNTNRSVRMTPEVMQQIDLTTSRIQDEKTRTEVKSRLILAGMISQKQGTSMESAMASLDDYREGMKHTEYKSHESIAKHLFDSIDNAYESLSLGLLYATKAGADSDPEYRRRLETQREALKAKGGKLSDWEAFRLDYDNAINIYENRIANREAGNKDGRKAIGGFGSVLGSLVGLPSSWVAANFNTHGLRENSNVLNYYQENQHNLTPKEGRAFGKVNRNRILRNFSAAFTGLSYKRMLEAGAPEGHDSYRLAKIFGAVEMGMETAADVVVLMSAGKLASVGKGAQKIVSKGIFGRIMKGITKKVILETGEEITEAGLTKTISSASAKTLIGKMLKTQAAMTTKETLKSSLSEASTEALQELSGYLSEQMGRQLAIDQGTLDNYEDRPHVLKQMGEAFYSAFLGTALLGGFTGSTSIIGNSLYRGMKKKKYMRVLNDLAKEYGLESVVDHQSEYLYQKVSEKEINRKMPVDKPKLTKKSGGVEEYTMTVSNRHGDADLQVEFTLNEDGVLSIMEGKYTNDQEAMLESTQRLGEILMDEFGLISEGGRVKQVTGNKVFWSPEIDAEMSAAFSGQQEIQAAVKLEKHNRLTREITTEMESVSEQLSKNPSQADRKALEQRMGELNQAYEKNMLERMELETTDLKEPSRHRGAKNPYAVKTTQLVENVGPAKATDSAGSVIFETPLASYLSIFKKEITEVVPAALKRAKVDLTQAFHAERYGDYDGFFEALYRAKNSIEQNTISKMDAREFAKSLANGKIDKDMAQFIGSLMASGYLDINLLASEYGISPKNVLAVERAAKDCVVSYVKAGSYVPMHQLKKYKNWKPVEKAIAEWNHIEDAVDLHKKRYYDAARNSVNYKEFTGKIADIIKQDEITPQQVKMTWDFLNYQLNSLSDVVGSPVKLTSLSEKDIAAYGEKKLEGANLKEVTREAKDLRKQSVSLKNEIADLAEQIKELQGGKQTAQVKEQVKELQAQKKEKNSQKKAAQDSLKTANKVKKVINSLVSDIRGNISEAAHYDLKESYSKLHHYFRHVTDVKAAKGAGVFLIPDLGKIRENIESQLEGLGVDPVVSDSTWKEIAENPKGNTLTLEQLRQLKAQRSILEQMGVNKRKVAVGAAQAAAHRFKSQLFAQLDAVKNKADQNNILGKDKVKEIKGKIKDINDTFRPPWFLFEAIDGQEHGLTYNYFVEKPMEFVGKAYETAHKIIGPAVDFMVEKGLMDKNHNYKRLTEKVSKDFSRTKVTEHDALMWAHNKGLLVEGVDTLGLTGEQDFSTLIDVMVEKGAIESKKTKGMLTKELQNSFHHRQFTYDEMMWVYSSSLNKQSFKAVMDKYNEESPGTYEQILKWCEESPEFADFKQAAHIILESTNANFSRLAEAAYKLTGRKMVYEPNYVRIIRTSAGKDFKKMAELADSLVASGQKEMGMLKERLDSAGGDIHIPSMVNDFLYTTQLGEYMIHSVDWTKETAELLESKEITNAFLKSYGKHSKELLDSYVADIFNPAALSSQNAANGPIRQILSNIYVSVLGAAVHIGLRQPVSMTYFTAESSPVQMAQSTKRFFSGQNDFTEAVREKSYLIWDAKLEQIPSDVVRMFSSGKRITKKMMADAKMRQYAGKMMNYFDAMAKYIGWDAVYTHARRKGLSETEAVRKADKALQQTQPMSNAAASSAIQKNETLKMFMMYTRQLFQNYANINKSVLMATNKITVEKRLARVFGLSTAVISSTLLYQLMASRDLPSDEEERKRFLWNTMTSNVPLVGRYAQQWGTGWGNADPLASAVNQVYYSYKDIEKMIEEGPDNGVGWKTTKGVLNMAGYAFGFPKNFITKPGDGVKSAIENDSPTDFFMTLLLGGPIGDRK